MDIPDDLFPPGKPAQKSRTLAAAVVVLLYAAVAKFSPEWGGVLRTYAPEVLVVVAAVFARLRAATRVPLRWGVRGAHAEAQRRRD